MNATERLILGDLKENIIKDFDKYRLIKFQKNNRYRCNICKDIGVVKKGKKIYERTFNKEIHILKHIQDKHKK